MPSAVIAEDEDVLRDELRSSLASLWPELHIAARHVDDGPGMVVITTDTMRSSHRSAFAFERAKYRTVEALVVSQVSSIRTVLDMMASVYFFDIVLSDKLYFRARGGSSVASLPINLYAACMPGVSPTSVTGSGRRRSRRSVS